MSDDVKVMTPQEFVAEQERTWREGLGNEEAVRIADLLKREAAYRAANGPVITVTYAGITARVDLGAAKDIVQRGTGRYAASLACDLMVRDFNEQAGKARVGEEARPDDWKDRFVHFLKDQLRVSVQMGLTTITTEV
jgi:hypothetical protein